jgi:hypothetical protein
MDTLHPKLGRWLMREQEAAQALARLGMEAAAERARQDAACLRGIFLLMEEHVPKPLPPVNGMGLRQLYGESLRLRGEYMAYADDPEYGCVLAALAEHKTARCFALLRRIGKG